MLSRSIAALVCALLVTAPAALAQPAKAPAPESESETVALEVLVARAARLRKATPLLEANLTEKAPVIRVFGGPPDSYELIEALLEAHNVALLVEGSAERPILHAYLVRDLATRQPVRVPFLEPGDPLPQENRIVTKAIAIAHADPQVVSNAIRGRMSLDPRRLGSLIHDPRTNRLLVTDLAPSVAYYERLAREMDVPVADPGAGNWLFEVEVWEATVPAVRAALEKPGGAAETLAAGGKRVASQGLTGVRGEQSTAVGWSGAGPNRLEVTVKFGRRAMLAEVALTFTVGDPVTYSLSAAREVELAPEKWVLAFADPVNGHAVLIRVRQA